MITIESKLDRFRATILGKLEKEAEYERFQSSADEERMLSRRREELEEEARELAKKEAKRAEDDYRKMVSDAKICCAKNALEAREVMFHEVVLSVEKLAKVFATSMEYKVYMKQKIKEIPLDYQSIETLGVACFTEDMAFIQEGFIEAGFTGMLEFSTLDNDFLGGFVLSESVNRSRFNLTLKDIIDDQSALIGQKLYELIEKAGE
jgi:vacuolar-type H+-ATPase subunit E/Vma4